MEQVASHRTSALRVAAGAAWRALALLLLWGVLLAPTLASLVAIALLARRRGAVPRSASPR